MIFLAVDVGGTHARLLLGEPCATGWRRVRQQSFLAHEYPGLQALLELFLAAGERPAAACIAVAGPVQGSRVSMTNLPWRLDASLIGQQFGIPTVRLLNDFAAQTYALEALPASDLCTLQQGQPEPEGVRALLGAGSGLGMAMQVRCGGHWQALASQGGLADFAPLDAQQLALCQALQSAYGRASQELLLSGPGLERIYGFLCGAGVQLREAAPNARAISRAAERGEPLAAAALALFARIYGACAGNLALLSLARGGVYLSGGIAPKILGFLQSPAVVEAFVNKPPLRELLESIPLHVVLNEQLGLFGAATLAAQLCRPSAAARGTE
ncbi:glucokinase [Pseudomonas sp. 2FG]|uniref:glucokinase n=1 Tax=Pseudomonas sp. 2FG TaxID=2502191 RepID=UPI0010F61252|nr:glucokinase [Pseudomonas sp. 2FG]